VSGNVAGHVVAVKSPGRGVLSREANPTVIGVVESSRNNACAVYQAAIRRTAPGAARFTPGAAHIVTDGILAIGFTLAVDRAMFEQATLLTKDVIAATVVVRTATLFGEICAVLGLAGPLALTGGCVATLAGLVTVVGTQAAAAVIAAALA